MAQNSPSAIARAQTLARLSHIQYGFNPTFAAVSPAYPGAKATVFDFTSRSQNFFQTRIAIDDIIGSTSHKFPLMTLYSGAGANHNLQKFSRFAGLLTVSVEVHLSYNKAQALQASEDWPDAVEETLITVFNRPETQNWPNTCVYNGQIAFERRPLIEGASGWLQTLFYRLTFEAVVNQL